MLKNGRQKLMLSGEDWTICGVDSGEGSPKEFTSKGFESTCEIPAIVPGDVHADLQRCGQLPDLYHGLNSKQVQWVAQKQWWYRKEFQLDKNWEELSSCLFFHGVDYACDVYLNGFHLGRHEGQFISFSFDVSDKILCDAQNVLLVKIDCAPENVVEKLFSQQGYGQPHQDAHDEMAKTLKSWKSSTVTGWDWGTPIWSAGIWQEVELIGTHRLFLDQPLVIPELQPPYDVSKLNITQVFRSQKNDRIKLFASVSCNSKDDEFLFTDIMDIDAGENKYEFAMEIQQPELWWPNGYGKQNFYSLKIIAEDFQTGKCLDSVSVEFGIRHLEILENPPAADNKIYIDYCPVNDLEYEGPLEKETKDISEPAKFLVKINGQPIFLKGGNWLPADLLYGVVDHTRYEHLIRSAAMINYNAFRIWGGGLIEKQAFYSLCDKYGILVLQEMPHAGRRPPENNDALEIEADELHKVLPQLINHPSVVRYGFGNELYIDKDNSRQVKQFLDICNKVDPSRPAYGPSPVTTGQRHGPHWFYFEDGYDIYNTGYPLDAGPVNPVEWDEYGAAGMSCCETLEKIIPTEHIWPIDEDDEYWVWHKAFKAYRQDRWLSRQNYQSVFGELPDLKTEIQVSQFAQAEGMRYANQAHRRRKWHRSGCLAWTYNEPWPNAAHGSIVEYYGEPKMAYYYVKKSYAMVDISAEYKSICCTAGKKLDADFWVTSDSDEMLEDRVVCIDYLSRTGKLLHQSQQKIQIAPQFSSFVKSSDYIVDEQLLGDVLLVRVTLKKTDNSIESQQWYTFGVIGSQSELSFESRPLRSLINSDYTELSINVDELKECKLYGSPMLEVAIEVNNDGEKTALFVKTGLVGIPSNSYYLSDNFFCLLPRESKKIKMVFSPELRNIIKDETGVCAEGWNTEAFKTHIKGV